MKRKQPKTIKKLKRQRNKVVARHPFVFIMLGTFGVVATYYGFQHILEEIPLIANNPIIALCVGLGTLILTGSLYKKLG